MNKTNKKFKDPGSAITHLIAMIGAVICAFPLIGKAVHTNNSIVVFCHECIYQQHDSSLRSKHPLPFFGYFKKGKSFLPKNRSFHDFRADCRFLHTSLLTGTR